jgi:2-C-methyl-D-erythritol 4-phosphate cytidylyltransferase
MGGAIPKQYLPLAGATVMEHALRPFLARCECAGLVVVLSVDDAHWRSLAISRDSRIATAIGGGERSDSVRAGLQALSSRVQARDWVLVHDAARPCLSDDDLARLLESLYDDDIGGLLAAPVVDTLKRADRDGRVSSTVDRAMLWHALTPQMFRYEILLRAFAARDATTDEAQAVEALSLKPKLVQGSADNLKITVPDDLVRAERILMARESREGGEAEREGRGEGAPTPSPPPLRGGGGVR